MFIKRIKKNQENKVKRIKKIQLKRQQKIEKHLLKIEKERDAFHNRFSKFKIWLVKRRIFTVIKLSIERHPYCEGTVVSFSHDVLNDKELDYLFNTVLTKYNFKYMQHPDFVHRSRYWIQWGENTDGWDINTYPYGNWLY